MEDPLLQQAEALQWVQQLEDEAHESLEDLRFNLLQMLTMHTLTTHKFEEVLGGHRQDEMLQKAVQSVTLPRDQKIRKWIVKTLPWIVAAVVFVGLSVYYFVQYGLSHEHPSWQLNVQSKDVMSFPTLLLCTIAPLNGIQCEYKGKTIPDCSTKAFPWLQISHGDSGIVTSSWNCSIVNYADNLSLSGEVEIALDRFDVILDVGKGVDLVANALLLDQKFDFERVSSIAEQGCSDLQLFQTLSSQPSSLQQFIVHSSVKALISFSVSELSFLDSSLDFTSYQGSPIENPYDGGISQISMSFVSQQVLQYKEEYSVTTSALVVNLIVSTGTLLSSFRLCRMMGNMFYRRWRRRVTTSRERNSLYVAKDVPMETLSGGEIVNPASWALRRGLHKRVPQSLPPRSPFLFPTASFRNT